MPPSEPEEPAISTLYIVATPIGNLKDITLRAIETLKSVDLVAAEDTRRTRTLLEHFDISVGTLSYFEHNEEKRIPQIIGILKEGGNVAIVSDAGTPGISDPAYRLVRAAVKEYIPVISIPGPSAAINALVQSGLPTDRFVFEGFLPKKKGRAGRLARLANDERSIILFESPERLVKTLNDCLDHFGNRPVAVCREMTKLHEEVYRGTLEEAVDYFHETKSRGEIVIVIGKDDPNVYFKERSKTQMPLELKRRS